VRRVRTADDGADVAVPGRWRTLAHVLAASGSIVLIVSLPLPFASNVAGNPGDDHHHEAARYYVWNPADNVGMPFLLLGVSALLYLWLSPRQRAPSHGCAVLGTLSGGFGLFVLYAFAPFMIESMHLYGGPDLDLRSSRWLVAVGSLLLWCGAMASSMSRRGRSHDGPPASEALADV
jgi:hypothetical protein